MWDHFKKGKTLRDEKGFNPDPKKLFWAYISMQREHMINQQLFFCRPLEFLTSGGGSKAWGNSSVPDRYKNNLRFYHDGQGFVSVQLSRTQANVSFYDVSGRNMHSFTIKKRGMQITAYQNITITVGEYPIRFLFLDIIQ